MADMVLARVLQCLLFIRKLLIISRVEARGVEPLSPTASLCRFSVEYTIHIQTMTERTGRLAPGNQSIWQASGASSRAGRSEKLRIRIMAKVEEVSRPRHALSLPEVGAHG